VDPLTLQPGDRFVQAHHFTLPSDAPVGPYTVGLGLYDPVTNDQWPILGSDGQPSSGRFLILADEIEKVEEEKP
jgi:hypothetical protein